MSLLYSSSFSRVRSRSCAIPVRVEYLATNSCLAVSFPQHTCVRQRRWLSVKELSWCAPSNSPNSRKKDPPNIHAATGFGIVAAMSQNRVIGCNGTIPWPRSAQDRKNFKDLTKDKIMILGRTTYEEEPKQRHISHANHCIVVSATLPLKDLESSNQGAPNTNLHVAKSFPEALELAKKISIEDSNASEAHADDNNESIQCWVCGGERVYEEALQHPSAQEVHLTTMHLEIDIPTRTDQSESQTNDDTSSIGVIKAYAMFPKKEKWDERFQEVSRVEGGPTDMDPNGPKFTYVTYIRRE